MAIAAMYLRQSKDNDDRIEGQRTRCAALILGKGWELGPEFVDNDVSGYKPRDGDTGWGRLLVAAERGEFQIVVAKAADRTSRAVSDVDRLRRLGITVVTLEGEHDLSTAAGRYQYTNLVNAAEYESGKKGERQVQANQDRVAQGRSSSKPRQRPFGYALRCGEFCGREHQHDYNVVTDSIVEPEAEAVRAAYRSIIAGSSLAAIARRWNEAGFRTSRGRDWTSGSLGLVLASPRYMGHVTYKREDAGAAVWDPIVDEATWRTARGVLGVGRSGTMGRGRTLLGQLAVCGRCGGPIQGGSNNGRRSYRCAGPKQHLSRKAADVEDLIAAAVQGRAAGPDAADLLLPVEEDLSAVFAEADALRARLKELSVDYAKGAITRPERNASGEWIRARLVELEARMVRSAKHEEVTALLAADTVKAGWDALDIDARRRLVDALMTVTLLPAPRGVKEFNPDTVQITWKAA